MVILRKLKASSLIETLTASVIIVLVFMVASFSFNNVFLNTIKSNTTALDSRLEEIKYLTENENLALPFYEEKQYWIITGEKKPEVVYFKISNLRNNRNFDLIIENGE